MFESILSDIRSRIYAINPEAVTNTPNDVNTQCILDTTYKSNGMLMILFQLFVDGDIIRFENENYDMVKSEDFNPIVLLNNIMFVSNMIKTKQHLEKSKLLEYQITDLGLKKNFEDMNKIIDLIEPNKEFEGYDEFKERLDSGEDKEHIVKDLKEYIQRELRLYNEKVKEESAKHQK